MHLQDITFTSISNLTHITSRRGRFTEFGFTSTQADFIEARAFGHLCPRSGYRLSLVMPGPDHWRNIYGWFDHSSKAIVMPFYATQLLVFSLVSAFSAVMLFVLLSAAFHIPFSWWRLPLAAGVMLIAGTWFMATREFSLMHQARNLLLELKRSLDAPGRVD
nr:hypothetical protein [uncultured Undibacterium sp.]